jgi:hypothetical protein
VSAEQAGAAAALLQLTMQHASLQSEHSELAKKHSAVLAELNLARERIVALETAAEQHEQSMKELAAKCAGITNSQEEAVASRNFYKRKCESLSLSLQKAEVAAADAASMAGQRTPRGNGGGGGLTPSGSSNRLSEQRGDQDAATAHAAAAAAAIAERERERERQAELAQLRATVSHLRTEQSGLQQTLAAYKKTLDSNFELLKLEREANLMLTHKAGAASGGGGVGGGGGGGGGGLFSRGGSSKSSAALQHQQSQFESVRSLANSLSELVAEKDLSLAHLKRSNQILARRVHGLEVRFARQLEAAGEGAHMLFGKIHLPGVPEGGNGGAAGGGAGAGASVSSGGGGGPPEPEEAEAVAQAEEAIAQAREAAAQVDKQVSPAAAAARAAATAAPAPFSSSANNNRGNVPSENAGPPGRTLFLQGLPSSSSH